jgi:hypothetical protein
MFSLVLVLALLLASAVAEVVILDTSNFEHLTQASTGATTGDWLIKFYGKQSLCLELPADSSAIF